MTFLLMMLACEGGAGTAECVDITDCDEGQACVDGSCATVQCLESSECEIGQFCDPRNYVCRAGCEVDDDCLAGQDCNTQTHECEDSACRTAELDCAVGQLCDSVTGQCYDSPIDLCSQNCDSMELWTGCSGTEACVAYATDKTCSGDGQCSGNETCDPFIIQYVNSASECPAGSTYGEDWVNGRYCYQNLCHEDFCMPTCNPNNADSCPAGFQCLSDGVSNFCYGECPYYVDNGYL
ncbi:MAG: hypothetical protein VX899_02520 [Myxococcota bacterium]|nr:hypothetical protein [Myxococcota bacterium]